MALMQTDHSFGILNLNYWNLFGPILRSGGACNLEFIKTAKINKLLCLAIYLNDVVLFQKDVTLGSKGTIIPVLFTGRADSPADLFGGGLFLLPRVADA